MLNGVVESSHNVREVASAIRGKGFERQNFGLGCDKMDEPGCHGAMAKIDVGRAIKNGRSRLIEDGGGGLLDVGGLLILDSCVRVAALHTADIKPFRGARLVAGEIVTGQENGIQNGMVHVHAGIDDGNNTSTANAKSVLRLLELNNLRRRLFNVPVPGNRAVVAYGCCVVKA